MFERIIDKLSLTIFRVRVSTERRDRNTSQTNGSSVRLIVCSFELTDGVDAIFSQGHCDLIIQDVNGDTQLVPKK